MPDDNDLVERIQRKDDNAFRRVVDEHGRYLYGIAYALAGHSADAEDLVQETFAAALSGTFRGESSLRTWLVSILVRRAAMLRRSAWHRRVFRFLGDHASSEGGQTTSAQRQRQERGKWHDADTADADARLDLASMLESLTPPHRAVIVLRELEGMSYEEMAGILGVPRGTVESRLHRAREELRRRYQGYLE